MFNSEMLARLKELAKRELIGADRVDPAQELGVVVLASYSNGVLDGQAELARDLLKDYPSGAIIFVEDVEGADQVHVQASFEPEWGDDVPPTPAQCVAIRVLQELKPATMDPESETPAPNPNPAEPPPSPAESLSPQQGENV